jgi:Luciferase-like monooxygenase
MRVCLMVEGQEDVSWEQWLGLAAACEEHGLEGLFRSDHYQSVMGRHERGSLDAWATLAALAARTSRVRLGTLVSPATFRHPSVLAKNVVTVDHVSGGRVELGLGAGWHTDEHRAYGFEMPPTATRRCWPSSSRSSTVPGAGRRSPSPAPTTAWRTCAPCRGRCSAPTRRCWSAAALGRGA